MSDFDSSITVHMLHTLGNLRSFKHRAFWLTAKAPASKDERRYLLP